MSGENARHDGEASQPLDGRSRNRSFSLLLIVGLGAWKLYEAFAAPTMRAALSPSLYAFGLGVFGVSVLGPRSLKLVTFFAGAALCLCALALDVST